MFKSNKKVWHAPVEASSPPLEPTGLDSSRHGEVKWSACRPFSSTIRVRIPLELTSSFSLLLKCCLKNNENEHKDGSFRPTLKLLLHSMQKIRLSLSKTSFHFLP